MLVTVDFITTIAAVVTVTIPVALSQHHHGGQEQYAPSGNLPGDDPGHNAHQETLIFACLGAVVIMAIIMVVLLWFFVDRTKDTVRLIERLLPEIIGRMKNGEERGEGPGHLSGTFDAKNEFEAGFKGSVDFIDATGDRVKLTSYSKKEDTITTVVDGTGPTGLTSYTRKLSNGDLPKYHHKEEAATQLPAYAKVDHQVKAMAEIDGPMSPRKTTPQTKNVDYVSEVKAKPAKTGLGGGGYISTSPHFNAYSPDHISGHSNPSSRVGKHDGHNRARHKPTPHVISRDSEKADLRNGDAILQYWQPPAYTAYDNQALSIDKRATLPVTTAPCSNGEKNTDCEEDVSSKKKRRASFYVESHV